MIGQLRATRKEGSHGERCLEKNKTTKDVKVGLGAKEWRFESELIKTYHRRNGGFLFLCVIVKSYRMT